MKSRHKSLSHLSSVDSADGRHYPNPSSFCSLTELAKTFVRPFFISLLCGSSPVLAANPLAQEFVTPPDSARPGSYWYFLDGNLNQKEMKADLDDMKKSGLGSVLFLEVDLGIPRGPVKMMSDQWIDYVAESIRYTEQLGMDYAIGTGPGWCGAGGPWVKPGDAMQHLVHSEVSVKGPTKFEAVLPLPKQLSTKWNNLASDFYEDVAVFAFPSRKPIIEDILEKALYRRDPFTTGIVRPFLDPSHYNMQGDSNTLLEMKDVVEITSLLRADGTLTWNVPEGDWTILRMGRRPTGAATRPAPESGLGPETSKFDPKAVVDHLDNYVGRIMEKVGPRKAKHGLNGLHMDSWESGSQNWSQGFLDEFKKRRGYDARSLLPIYSGRAIGSIEKSERFLWDVRVTAQELVLENHAQVVKNWGKKHNLRFSIQPYDMNPAGDLDLGAVADVPMGEFWVPGGGKSAYSCIEATSIAHVMGRPVVGSEAFTSVGLFDTHPASLKNQTDWALAIGINSFWFHTYAHQPLGDDAKPGMTFGPYGTNWNRNQTWWPMAKGLHEYMARCSHMLRQGVTVSDILYVTPEGAPHVFRPPLDATTRDDWFPDKRGYSFDGCSPLMLRDRAEVKDGMIAFPGGTSYRLMVLSQSQTMTPAGLRVIRDLIKEGATVVGTPPQASPSLVGYPESDAEVKKLSEEIWGSLEIPSTLTKRSYGKGTIYWGGPLTPDPKKQKIGPMADSKWIWYPGENGASSAPPATRYFTRDFEVSPGKQLQSANIWLVADNAYTLLINGQKVAESNAGGSIKAEPISIQKQLVPGKNRIAVSVSNAGGAPNPAGLLSALEVIYQDGTNLIVQTNEEWAVAAEPMKEWELAQTVMTGSKAAEVIGQYDMAPWGRQDPRKIPPYPAYAETSDLLKSMGVAEDFASQAPLRFTHRQTSTQDIYFVANRSENFAEGDCHFRIGVGEPHLWDPLTAEQRALSDYSQENGVTRIPLKFDAHQSFFIIFEKAAGKQIPSNDKVGNFPKLNQSQELAGSWEVAFDPTRGGPEKVSFESLKDWTQNDQPGIKYYSGIATYRKSFTHQPVVGKRFYLDLGVVNNAARVRLNGKDLGAVWCAPWQVELTQVLLPGENRLEIDVANLWKNRLIGDQRPEDREVRELKWPDGLLDAKTIKTGRYTYTPASPYNNDKWPLSPSGLMGPVRILVAD